MIILFRNNVIDGGKNNKKKIFIPAVLTPY